VTDKNGRLLPKLNTGLTGKVKGGDRTVFSYDTLYLDEKGRTTFAAPTVVICVSGDMQTRENGVYEVIVQAKEVPAQYPLAEPVEPAKKTEYTVVFSYGY